MFKISKDKGTLLPVERRRTRADNKVKIPLKQFRYVSLQKCPIWRGVWEWDDIDPDVQIVAEKAKFRSLVHNKKHRRHLR